MLTAKHNQLGLLLGEALEARGRLVLRARGSCLGRQLPTGSLMLLESLGDEPPRLGELVAYLDGRGRLTVHRLCRRNALGWWASPDARVYAEPTGPLIGRVRRALTPTGAAVLPSRPGRARFSWRLFRFCSRLTGGIPRWLSMAGYRLLLKLFYGPLTAPQTG